VRTLAEKHRGMILVTGVTGSGKSTTMATMLRYILQTRRCHVVTVEDPIEFIYPNESGVVTQREVGIDCESFLMALRHALRQDPDVMLIGEMRDGETIRTALAAAETGHLVFSTLHTLEAQTTIERILSFFPGHEQFQIRMELANNLVGVVSQRLVPRSDKPGIVPVLEIMLGTGTVQKCITENRVKDIRQAIQNREDGMQTFNQHLLELIDRGWITEEVAYANSGNPSALRRMISGGMSGGDQQGLVGM
jgi:twitching motility protein PilT